MGTLAGLYAVAPSTQILPENYHLQADNQGFYGSMRMWFSGSDLGNFSSYCAGAPQTVVVGGTSVTRLIPLKHPLIANCYCDQIDIYPPDGEPPGFDGTNIQFGNFFADLHFSTPTYQYESGDYPTVTIKLDGRSEMVTVPGSAYKFPSDGLAVNHDCGIPVKCQTFSLQMNRLPSLDTSLYLSLTGCVNSEEFYGCDPGTVLYNGCSCTGQYTIGGLPSFDATHVFEYRSIPHNEIMRPDGGGFEAPVQRSDGTTKLLPEADLNQLWGM